MQNVKGSEYFMKSVHIIHTAFCLSVAADLNYVPDTYNLQNSPFEAQCMMHD